MTLAISGTTGITLATQFDSASTFGFKNRLINGQMQIAQRGTSGTSGSTVPTTAPTYPSIDRWYAYATGATVTVAQAAGSGATKNTLQVTGAASVTAVGVGQRIEQLNSYDLAGSTCTLSVNMSNSLLTTVTWTASYATSADTWSAKTTISTGTFTVTSSLVNYSAQIIVPAAATTGIEILFTVGAQISGTWVVGNAQFEKSSTVATSFDFRDYGTELALCQRYYEMYPSMAYRNANGTIISGTSILGNMVAVLIGFTGGTGSQSYLSTLFKIEKRATPTVTFSTRTTAYTNQVETRGGSTTYISLDKTPSGFFTGASQVTPGADNYLGYGYEASSEL